MTSTESNYKTQSRDTNLKTEQFLIQAYRTMPAWRKAHLINEATKGLQHWAIIGIHHQYPLITLEEVKVQLAVRWLGKEIANHLKVDSNKIMDAESITIALKIAEILETLTISYLIGGSIASSVLGEPRATLDIDIVADLDLSQLPALINLVKSEFYIDEITAREAVKQRSSFNIIHLNTLLKVDIFILSNHPLSQIEMQRRQQIAIAQNPERLIWVASAEDIILQKLIWYNLENRISDRQWRDILGVLKVQSERLDFNYLTQWSQTLQLEDILSQAFQQAGLNY